MQEKPAVKAAGFLEGHSQLAGYIEQLVLQGLDNDAWDFPLALVNENDLH